MSRGDAARTAVGRAEPYRVRQARPDEWRRLGYVLSDAFQDDPVWSWICPNPERRRRHLPAVFAQVVRARVRHGWGWTTDGIHGAAAWAAPDRWKTRPFEAARIGPPILRAIGPHDLRMRLAALASLERHHPRDLHWYLEILGSDPTMRGQGIGGSLMVPTLERCDRGGMPAYLESSKEENIPFYERFGFRVTGELHMVPGAPTMWAMWRDPA